MATDAIAGTAGSSRLTRASGPAPVPHLRLAHRRASMLYMASTSLKTLAETITRSSAIPFDPYFWPSSRSGRTTGGLGGGALLSLLQELGGHQRHHHGRGARRLLSRGVRLRQASFPRERPDLLAPPRHAHRPGDRAPDPQLHHRLSPRLDRSPPGSHRAFIGSAFAIFLLRQFFAQIPDELIESSSIDGATHPRILASVVVPCPRRPSSPSDSDLFRGMERAAVAPRGHADPRWRPIAVGLTTFISEAGPQTQLRMAGAIDLGAAHRRALLPGQKQFTEAISRSGLKG